jgi:undecaprenyl-diphosphatase
VGWLGLLAAFVGLCFAVHRQHPLLFDMRATLWVQDLERIPCAGKFFEFANTAGEPGRVAAIAGIMLVFLLLRGMRFEATAVAGVVGMRLLQLAIRHSIDWPEGQSAYFVTTQPLPHGASFPSGHVLGEVLVYGLLFLFARRLWSADLVVILVRVFCALVIVLGAPARMYVGAHWPSDLVGAAMLAALYLLPVLWLDVRRAQAHASIETRSHRGSENFIEQKRATLRALMR